MGDDETIEIEATGETVGEAKWSALRELERLHPGLDKSAVELVVLAEGERGLLGVGFAPARVLARARPGARPVAAPRPAGGESPAVTLLSELLERVVEGLGLDVSVSVGERGDGLAATFAGRDLGLLIGKHGQTLDALQYLANVVLSRVSGERVEVVLDAAGYRERRRAVLEALADRAAARALAEGVPVVLEPMTSFERKIVHLRLKERSGVTTASEGVEPNRHVTVSPTS